jgi:hypothetical protein
MMFTTEYVRIPLTQRMKEDREGCDMFGRDWERKRLCRMQPIRWHQVRMHEDVSMGQSRGRQQDDR